ncbi:hypothetical protein A616_30455 [Brevibacillus brevis X23]|nr:hypothetical protein A616_30455 [Brevibacillus brevis X23]
MSQRWGGEEKAEFSSTLTRPQGGFTGLLHCKKGTVEPKPPYGRKLLKEEVFDKRGPLFAVPTGLALSRSTSPVLFLLASFVGSSMSFKT